MRTLLRLRRFVSAATVMAVTVAGLPVLAATRDESSRCRAMAQMGHECHRPSAALSCCCSDDDSQNSGVPAERNGSLTPTPSAAGVEVVIPLAVVHFDQLVPSPGHGYRNRDLPTLFATLLL